MLWVCTECGLNYDSDMPPKVCPLCGAPNEKLTQVKETSKK